jgi:DNA-binding Lrp family transcriptional regulator
LPMAYVLFNTEIGSEREVLKAVKDVDGVQEAFGLFGVYDIIARVRADTKDTLAQIVNKKLQLSKVHTKLTVIVSET